MTDIAPQPMFQRLALIGAGLIGSSLAHIARREKLAGHIAVTSRSPATLKRVAELGFADSVHAEIGDAVAGADLVILCVPVGACGAVAEAMAPHLAPGAIVTDVGSVKQAVIRDVQPHIPAGVHFVPGHPIAGTEHSGPDSGFAELFNGRGLILTPIPGGDEAAVARLRAFWEAAGSTVTEMDAAHHDKVLAITSHLPHLIAYTIVGTAVDLEESTKNEVIKFSASGFRDFTRIAASDPVMWRDIFLNNREAVLEMLQRFSEDLTHLQRAIRWGEGDKLEDLFTRTRAIRRGVIAAKQA
ncbi:MAG: prephenate/arogenate dehydrogenase family protein [Alphaproteobacteria bacterium]|nr:prephenate/arogenate dehydrogenase family protein [Alphaproteobacteria bacterium]MBU0796113.1 prephenate/arogenate dehydrogenase family protein [Alphaproteobacteria bacterium]MBU0888484.1 prephenate/arogenate dehydrogenase family protein [Alphaproteobacteria bacterium]MBU1813053.1 prephenate/arogenate dehydrogenase family protein [Alphaproteobacteria bacterium]